MIKPPAVYAKYKPTKNVPKTEDIIDHIIYFFKEDNLGTLSNMHLAYCDKLGKEGPNDEKALRLSRLVAVAVDFAKHGECVTEEDYKGWMDVKEWPDYMEKAGKENVKSYESKLINGIIYRQVNTEQYYENCI